MAAPRKDATYPVKAFASAKAFATWLRSNHAQAEGVWVVFVKGKDSKFRYADALDVALAWGWIDGQSQSIDDATYKQKYTPRRARSMWSKRNRVLVQAIIERGEMQPAGLAEIERAKADGRWDAAYDGAKNATVPDDLAHALAKNARARAFFETLSSANRYAILHNVQTAVKPETRARRIAAWVAKCARGEKKH